MLISDVGVDVIEAFQKVGLLRIWRDGSTLIQQLIFSLVHFLFFFSGIG